MCFFLSVSVLYLEPVLPLNAPTFPFIIFFPFNCFKFPIFSLLALLNFKFYLQTSCSVCVWAWCEIMSLTSQYRFFFCCFGGKNVKVATCFELTWKTAAKRVEIGNKMWTWESVCSVSIFLHFKTRLVTARLHYSDFVFNSNFIHFRNKTKRNQWKLFKFTAEQFYLDFYDLKLGHCDGL